MWVEIDGGPPTAAALHRCATVNYGHFTTMQVRGHRVRGLDLHLHRLRAATVELFGTDLEPDLVRRYVRGALGGDGSASVRVDVFRLDDGAVPSVMVSVRPPTEAARDPRRLRTAVYRRPAAHLNHVGTFGQLYHGVLAEREGYHDALLVGADGTIYESGTANIGFVERDQVIWPEGPVLTGVTMQLLDRALPVYGISTSHHTVRLADVSYFSAGFVSNWSGVAPVGRIDDVDLAADEDTLQTIRMAYDAVPWDPI